MRRLISEHFKELLGDTIILLFVFWSAFTLKGILTVGYRAYIEPNPWIAFGELILAFLIIPFGVERLLRDLDPRQYSSLWWYLLELIGDGYIIVFGFWSLTVFVYICTEGMKYYGGETAVFWWAIGAIIGVIIGIALLIGDFRELFSERGVKR